MNYLKTIFQTIVVGFCCFAQTLNDINMIYNDTSGLHVCFSEWRKFRRGAWQRKSNHIQIDKDNDLVDMYSI